MYTVLYGNYIIQDKCGVWRQRVWERKKTIYKDETFLWCYVYILRVYKGTLYIYIQNSRGDFNSVLVSTQLVVDCSAGNRIWWLCVCLTRGISRQRSAPQERRFDSLTSSSSAETEPSPAKGTATTTTIMQTESVQFQQCTFSLPSRTLLHIIGIYTRV